MIRLFRVLGVALLAALPLAAQPQSDPNLVQAQQVLILADGAGAQTYAKTLYDDAAYRIRFAQENINSPKASMQEPARMRAREALFAARAALAKAQWLSTNAAVRNLQADINRFGGKSDLLLQDEDVNIDFHRGNTTKERMATAQAAIDQARAAGAEQTVPDNDLKAAAGSLDSARKVSRDGRQNSDVADYLAYVAEMIARRAYYSAKFDESSRFIPDLQLQRTRLAQASSAQQAATERAQREEAERRATALQQQLNAEAANRQAQAAELDRLRQQVEQSRLANQQRMETDRAARLQAERLLDQTMRQYETAVTSGNTADNDRLRRQVEDQEIALRAVQERERLDAQAMAADLAAMRNQPVPPPADVLAQRQAEIEQYQAELRADVAARADIQRRHEQAVAAARTQRSGAEARAAAMQQQLIQAQQAAAEAAQAAQAARQQSEQTQQQMQQMQQKSDQQMQALQQQAQQTQQQLAQQAQQSQAEAEKARQSAQAAQAELEKTRQELAQREAEARQLRMQQELARIAATKAESRGIVVTLPGIFFDSGKYQLKPGAKSTLDKIATQVNTESSVKITVEGHTDNVGAPEKNQQLSEKRAGAVRDYLVSRGIPAERITAVGKGESEPIATNKTVAGRQQNRRVELVITM